MNRSDAKRQIDLWRSMITTNVNLLMRLNDREPWELQIIDISMQSTSQMTNAPDKRIDGNGKQYTPAVMRMQTTAGVLYFVIEDMLLTSIVGGFRIIIGPNQLDFRIKS